MFELINVNLVFSLGVQIELEFAEHYLRSSTDFSWLMSQIIISL